MHLVIQRLCQTNGIYYEKHILNFTEFFGGILTMFWYQVPPTFNDSAPSAPAIMNSQCDMFPQSLYFPYAGAPYPLLCLPSWPVLIVASFLLKGSHFDSLLPSKSLVWDMLHAVIFVLSLDPESWLRYALLIFMFPSGSETRWESISLLHPQPVHQLLGPPSIAGN